MKHSSQSRAKGSHAKEKRKKQKAVKLFHYTTLLHLLKGFLNFHFMNQNPIHGLNFTKAWKIKKYSLSHMKVLNDSEHVIEV